MGRRNPAKRAGPRTTAEEINNDIRAALGRSVVPERSETDQPSGHGSADGAAGQARPLPARDMNAEIRRAAGRA